MWQEGAQRYTLISITIIAAHFSYGICANNGTNFAIDSQKEDKAGPMNTTQSTSENYGTSESNITNAPWHVAIYSRLPEKFIYICGGSIISEKVVISAAHCFWDQANGSLSNHSIYAVGAGKMFRDYYKTEQFAQFSDISNLHVPLQFAHKLNSFKSDIAVIILSKDLILSPFISAISIKWKEGTEKSIEGNKDGEISLWGLEENANSLRTANVVTSSFSDCIAKVKSNFIPYVTSDKICTFTTIDNQIYSTGSGGGLVVKDYEKKYLVGVLSTGIPNTSSPTDRGDIGVAMFTNIQYYENFIRNLLNTHRVQ